MMRRVIVFTHGVTSIHGRPAVLWLVVGLLAGLTAPGCHRPETNHYTSVSKPPNVQLVKPQVRDLVRVIGLPSFTQSYERSSVYPKMNAYIQKWNVDIGDRVKKGDELATLFVPELVEDHITKKATVELDRERIALAKETVQVAKADVAASEARVEECQAELVSYQAEAERWDSELKRLTRELKRGVVNPQDVLQTTNRRQSSVAMRDTASATVRKAEAELLSRRASLSKAGVDVKVAEANLQVAVSEEKRLQAWVDYLVLPAPFDGVIVARNANTFDFVLPTTGDPSASRGGPYLSPKGIAAPIYVVDRIDVVRIFVDVPEQDADHVQIGTKATVLLKAYNDKPISATVTRTSWALNTVSRTLRAEIDLPNRGNQLLPGMYAYTKVNIERPGVWSLPVSALMHLGDHTVLRVGDKAFCWTYANGLVKRIEVQIGVNTGEWVEVTNHRIPNFDAASTGAEPWTPFDGTEQVILGNLSILADDLPVTVVPTSDPTKLAAGKPQTSGR